MSEWKEVILADYIETNIKSIGKDYPFTTIQYLDTGSITANRIEKLQEFNISDAPSRAKRLIEENDIIYSSVRPNQLHYGFIKHPEENLVVSTGFVVVNCNKEKLYSKFLFYYLSSDSSTEYLHSIAEASTSAYPSLKPSDIEALGILLPPLPEQKAIAEVLCSLDDKIDMLHRQNKTLEQMAETLFRQWFIEEADESWEERQLGGFVKPQKGKNITKKQAVEGNFPVIAGGLGPSCFHNKSNTKAPVITVSASGANSGFVNLHHNPVWSSDSSFIDYSITPYVYFYYIFLKINQKAIFDKQEGSAQPHIYPSHLMDLNILDYPVKLIKEFENIISDSFEKIKLNKSQIHTIEKMRDTLLPKLMSGDVRMKI